MYIIPKKERGRKREGGMEGHEDRKEHRKRRERMQTKGLKEKGSII